MASLSCKRSDHEKLSTRELFLLLASLYHLDRNGTRGGAADELLETSIDLWEA